MPQAMLTTVNTTAFDEDWGKYAESSGIRPWWVVAMESTEKVPCGPTDKLILFALISWSTPEGVVWPRKRHLATRCAVDETTVRRSLRKLEALGAIEKTREGGGYDPVTGRGITSRYQLSFIAQEWQPQASKDDNINTEE